MNGLLRSHFKSVQNSADVKQMHINWTDSTCASLLQSFIKGETSVAHAVEILLLHMFCCVFLRCGTTYNRLRSL